MPTSTRATKASTTGSNGSVTSSAGKKPRAKGVTSADAEILQTSVASVSDIPRTAKASKNRNNPYDKLLAESYERNDEGSDSYVQVKTTKGKEDAQIKLIRSAATFLEIGSRILNPQDNGDGSVTIWFRGQVARKRGPRKKDTETSE